MFGGGGGGFILEAYVMFGGGGGIVPLGPLLGIWLGGGGGMPYPLGAFTPRVSWAWSEDLAGQQLPINFKFNY